MIKDRAYTVSKYVFLKSYKGSKKQLNKIEKLLIEKYDGVIYAVVSEFNPGGLNERKKED